MDLNWAEKAGEGPAAWGVGEEEHVSRLEPYHQTDQPAKLKKSFFTPITQALTLREHCQAGKPEWKAALS